MFVITEPRVEVTLVATHHGWQATLEVDGATIWDSGTHPTLDAAMDAARLAVLGTPTVTP
ncbi:MAG: hypothetical protein ACXV3V_11035 [Actinomycetes bacterium]